MKAAILQGADIGKANLKAADLSGADLRGANLASANMDSADLHDAIVIGAHFKNASLENANLVGLEIDAGVIADLPPDLVEKFKTTWRTSTDVSEIREEQAIVRAMEFPGEFTQPALGLLNYFGAILRYQYPGTSAKIRVEQDGLKVKLAIETDEENHDKIEKALDSYGLVAAGRMKPEKFLRDPRGARALQFKLDLARVEAKQTLKLLYGNDPRFEGKPEILEKRALMLYHLVGQCLWGEGG